MTKLYNVLCQIQQQIGGWIRRDLIKHGRTPFEDYRIGIQPTRLSFPGTGIASIRENYNRQGFVFTNVSTDFMYILFSEDQAASNKFTLRLDIGQTEFYIPANYVYKGKVNFLAADPTGFCMVNEFSYQNLEK